MLVKLLTKYHYQINCLTFGNAMRVTTNKSSTSWNDHLPYRDKLLLKNH